jgi:ATP-dependent RNA helicase DDX23/PRP28
LLCSGAKFVLRGIHERIAPNFVMQHSRPRSGYDRDGSPQTGDNHRSHSNNYNRERGNDGSPHGKRQRLSEPHGPDSSETSTIARPVNPDLFRPVAQPIAQSASFVASAAKASNVVDSNVSLVPRFRSKSQRAASKEDKIDGTASSSSAMDVISRNARNTNTGMANAMVKSVALSATTSTIPQTTDIKQQPRKSSNPAARSGRERFKFDWSTEDDTYTVQGSTFEEEARDAWRIAQKVNVQHSNTHHNRNHSLYDDDYDATGNSKAMKRSAANVHWSEKPLAEMQPRDWRILREDFSITLKGGNLPHPLRKWGESELLVWLKNALEHRGYTTPTPVQRATVPIALIGRDVMGIARTGSGKTAAFLLPLLQRIMEMKMKQQLKKQKEQQQQQQQQQSMLLNEGCAPSALILAPTRELAQQIHQECLALLQAAPAPFPCGTACVVGGINMEEQLFALSPELDLLVATPGRLVDLLDRRVLTVGQVAYAVLDEADRMLEMGFAEQLRTILSECQPAAARQTLMFSATMPTQVEAIASEYLRHPAIVDVGERGSSVVEQIRQEVFHTKSDHDKRRVLSEALEQAALPAMCFVNTKNSADSVARFLQAEGWSAIAYHGGKAQEVREDAVAGLKSGKYQVLVATDVAGRGLDINDVGLVVNYELPRTIEEYTHRIGRTGRAGKKGHAISCYHATEDAALASSLLKLLKIAGAHIPQALQTAGASRTL